MIYLSIFSVNSTGMGIKNLDNGYLSWTTRPYFTTTDDCTVNIEDSFVNTTDDFSGNTGGGCDSGGGGGTCDSGGTDGGAGCDSGGGGGSND